MTKAPCIEVHPPPQYHSGWECSDCGEIRWGGVISASGPTPIGYTFSGGFMVCWRCHRLHTQSIPGCSDTNYPRLSFLSGYMMVVYDKDKGPFERHCDECGHLVEPGC